MTLSGLFVGAAAQAQDGPTLGGLMAGDASGKQVIAPAEETTYFLELQQVFAKPELENSRGFNAEIGPPRGVDFDYDPESSARVIFGFMKPTTGLGFRARYWSFDDSSSPLVGTDANGLIADDAIAIVAGGGIDDVDAVTVLHNIDAHVVDLEGIKQFNQPDLLGSLGLRIVKFDQGYLAATDEGTLSSSLDFIGLGPTAGVEGSYQIGESDFSLFGNARVSALIGQRDLSSNNVDTVNGGAARISDDGIELAYGADAQAGIEWSPRRFQHIGFYTRAGLEFQYWGNIGNLRDISDPALDDTITGGTTSGAGDYDGDIDFIGFFLSAGFQF